MKKVVKKKTSKKVVKKKTSKKVVKKVSTHLKLTESVNKSATVRAAKAGVTKSEWVERAIKHYNKHHVR